MNRPALLVRILVLAVLALASVLPASMAAESNTLSAPVAATRTEETNSQSQELLREYRHLQEQLHSAQLAIEQNRQETKDAADQAAKALAGRLEAIEQALTSQRARELEAMQSSNHVLLIVVGSFATVGLAALLLMAWFQWRAVNRLAQISATLPAIRSLGQRPAVAALGSGEPSLVTVGPAEQSSLRLLGALERLEKRIYQLDHSGQPHLTKGAAPSIGLPPSLASSNGNGAPPVPTEPPPPADTGPISLLLAKGQSMVSLNDAAAALACFDEVLALDPDHSEALVKKGSVLEQLERFDEAVACYDQAITKNPSMTIAYLHKGGLFNRMERFNEALECYEQALRTQQKPNGTAEP